MIKKRNIMIPNKIVIEYLNKFKFIMKEHCLIILKKYFISKSNLYINENIIMYYYNCNNCNIYNCNRNKYW